MQKLILKLNLCFRTNDKNHPGPYLMQSICHAQGLAINDCWFRHPKIILLIISLCGLFTREVLECLTIGPKQYFRSKENYLQLFIYSLTTSFIIIAPLDMVTANHIVAWALMPTALLNWLCTAPYIRNHSPAKNYLI